MAIKSMSIRIDEKMLNKLHAVADYEGRSANSQINILIRDCIEQFEEKHGKIQQGEWSFAVKFFAHAKSEVGGAAAGEVLPVAKWSWAL